MLARDPEGATLTGNGSDCLPCMITAAAAVFSAGAACSAAPSPTLVFELFNASH